MQLSASQAERLNEQLAAKREVRCTTFDFAKTIEVLVNGGKRAYPMNLTSAKHYASEYLKLHPGDEVKVVEIKKKVHEFYIKERP